MRQIKYETKNENRFSTDFFVDTIAAQELCNKLTLSSSKHISGFIQNSSMNPFGFILLSEIQVSDYRF